MLPNSVNLYVGDVNNPEEYVVRPTLTYRMDKVNKRIIGKIEDREAVLQFVTKVLDTSKYAYEIYDWYYGNELLALVGKPYEYIIAEVPRIVREALLVDDRINEVNDFEFQQTSVDSMTASFTVETVYGDIDYTLEVSF